MNKIDDEFNKTIDNLHATIDLQNEYCHLKHSEEDPAENHPAVDYLCQSFGYENIKNEEFRIPICEECVEALSGNEWVLFYCVQCHNSQWLCRKYAKFSYPTNLHVKWVDECPICFEVKKEKFDDGR